MFILSMKRYPILAGGGCIFNFYPYTYDARSHCDTHSVIHFPLKCSQDFVKICQRYPNVVERVTVRNSDWPTVQTITPIDPIKPLETTRK